MKQRDIEMQKAIEKSDTHSIKRLAKIHGVDWLNSLFIKLEFHEQPWIIGQTRLPGGFYMEYAVTPLYYAVCRGSLEAVVALIAQGVALNIFGNMNETALHRAAYLGLYDIVKYLVLRGSDIDIQQGTKNLFPGQASCLHTPLHVTILDCSLDEGIYSTKGQCRTTKRKIAKFLIKMGANLQLKDYKNFRAFDAAQTAKRTDIQDIIESAFLLMPFQTEITDSQPELLEQDLTSNHENPKNWLFSKQNEWQLNKGLFGFITGLFVKPIEITALLKPLNGIERLKTLDLSNKKIDDNTIQLVIWLLQQNCFFRELDLQNNTLTTSGLRLLSIAIAEHPQLELVNIQNNPDISSQEISNFIASLNNNNRLLAVHLPLQATQEQKADCNRICFRNIAMAKQLIEHASTGDANKVQQLLQQGTNVHYDQEAAIVQATYHHHANIVELLLNSGANPYVPGKQGLSAQGIAEDLSDPNKEPKYYLVYLEILKHIDNSFNNRLQSLQTSVVKQASSLNIPAAALLSQFGQFTAAVRIKPQADTISLQLPVP